MRIAEALKARPEPISLLQQMAGGIPQPSEPKTEELQGDLPSAEEVLKDLEGFLRRPRGDQPADGTGGAA